MKRHGQNVTDKKSHVAAEEDDNDTDAAAEDLRRAKESLTVRDAVTMKPHSPCH
jgi:hypothetical protein